MSKQPNTNDSKLVERLLSGRVEEKYQGKQVVVMKGKVYILPEDDRQAVSLVERLEEKYPDQTPHLIFVARPETYVL